MARYLPSCGEYIPQEAGRKMHNDVLERPISSDTPSNGCLSLVSLSPMLLDIAFPTIHITFGPASPSNGVAVGMGDSCSCACDCAAQYTQEAKGLATRKKNPQFSTVNSHQLCFPLRIAGSPRQLHTTFRNNSIRSSTRPCEDGHVFTLQSQPM